VRELSRFTVVCAVPTCVVADLMKIMTDSTYYTVFRNLENKAEILILKYAGALNLSILADFGRFGRSTKLILQ